MENIKITMPDSTVINYSEFGNADDPAVFFLHGWTGTKDPHIPLCKRIAERGYHTFAVDLRSTAASSASMTRPVTMALQAQDICDMIKILKLDQNHKVSILGHSCGGMDVLYYLGNLDCSNISCGMVIDPNILLVQKEGWPAANHLGKYTMAEGIKDYDDILDKGIVDFVVGMYEGGVTGVASRNEEEHKALVAMQTERSKLIREHEVAEMHLSMVNYDGRIDLPKVQAPMCYAYAAHSINHIPFLWEYIAAHCAGDYTDMPFDTERHEFCVMPEFEDEVTDRFVAWLDKYNK